MSFNLHRKLLLQILVILIIYMLECVCRVESEAAKKATGYIGEQVVLKLDVDPTWKLTVIEWSIYTNFTYIATFQGDQVKLLNDRYHLNKTSGDLTITKLMAKDALKYTVLLENERGDEETIHVQLSVQEQVSKPNITVLHSFLDGEKCVMSLMCSSLSSTISLSWNTEHGFSEHFCSDSPAIIKSVMWTSLRTNRNAIFTCIATDGNHKESSQWHGKCLDSVQELSNCSQEHSTASGVCTGRGAGGLIVGLLVGAIVGIIGAIAYLQHNGSNLMRSQCPWFSRIFFQHAVGKEDSKEDENTRTEDKPGEEEKIGPETEMDKQEQEQLRSPLEKPASSSSSV